MNQQLVIPGFESFSLIEHSKTEDKFGNYGEFVEKYKGKLTTDDCYTPAAVYDALLAYFREKLIGGRNVVRPFYPGGDYKKYDYKDGDVVFDNPPFSIYTKICRWYVERGIDFVLFAPTNTMLIRGLDGVTYIITSESVTYENGAEVNTSFTTNMTPGYRFMVDNELCRTIHDANISRRNKINLREYDTHFTSSALLRKLAARGGSLVIRDDECRIVDNFDVMKDKKVDMFGLGVILSDDAAKRKEYAIENATGNSYKVKDYIFPTEREKKIIQELSQQKGDGRQ